ncbi:MAG TPA: sigma-70 family RNA polymerase sigma factor [Candidatus Deferrimicrobium sp.]|nr:sigma-70 family RNA polymerase sigma factor [Candidatus Deferrimicrobium sp.]
MVEITAMEKADNEIVADLVVKARQGSKEAFSRLVRLLMKNVVALTYRMTQDKDSAFDLAQETFVTAWQRLSDFRGESSFGAWLYRIATNKTLNYLKQQSGRREMSLDDAVLEVLPPQASSADPEQSMRDKQLQQHVLAFMAQLPPQQRLVFDLRFYKEMSFEEITHITGRAVGTVKTHYRLAVAKLRSVAQRGGWRR